MHPTCHDARTALAGSELQVFEAHARTCTTCRAFATRLQRGERALVGLARIAAPASLDGRVVAALEAGQREERAIRALRRLDRVEVPEHLDHAVARTAAPIAPAPLAAPDVLRRLVEEELSDPSKARAQRFVGSLERVAAPDQLFARVQGALTQPPPKRSFRSRLLAGGAALVVVATTAILWYSNSRETPRARIQWVRVDSVDELSPLAASFVAGLSGGASDVSTGRGAR
ncbi:MAG: hypothetical protein IT453_21110 [Planctomycetes bacterium]|nr:hypothetical protein [Planctomycetota bacterium]